MKTILITGGCGFIGTNVALYFAERNERVIALDNLSRPGSEHNKALLTERGIQCVAHDVSKEPEALAALIEKEAVDVIIHAAAQVAVTTSVQDPLFDFYQNGLGTLHVLDAARRASKKPLVLFTSTNKVYGGLEHVRVEEGATRYSLPELPQGVHEDVPLDFHSPYGCSKGAADQYTRDWSRIYGVPTIVFRQSCIYGPHQFGIVDQGWVAYLTMQAYFGKPITIYGDGKQVRDILSIGDLARAMDAAIASPAAAGNIYNMGGGPQYTSSLLEFVAFLEHRLNKKLEVSFSDWRPGDQKVYISDIKKAKRDFGWEPTRGLEVGFEEMFSWIEANKNILEAFV